MRKIVVFLILGMKCIDHRASKQVIVSQELFILLRSKMFRLPLCGVIVVHRNQPQYHLGTPYNEILTIKIIRLQSSNKTTDRKLPNIRFLDC